MQPKILARRNNYQEMEEYGIIRYSFYFLVRRQHEVDVAYEKIISSTEPLPLSTPSSIRVGPFARQAQVSHVLNILMMHLQDQKLGKSFDAESADQIARTLTAFSMLLPEETPQPWPRYCGAIGMCYRSTSPF